MREAGKVRLEVTSSAVRGEAGLRNLAECRQAAEEFGFVFGVQLHNTEEAAALDRLAALEVPLSVHAPLLGDSYLNLAAEGDGAGEELRRRFEVHARYFARYGITDAVFHGFMMTDRPVPNFGRGGRGYDECMAEIFRPELSWDGAGRLNCDFTGSEEFIRRRALVGKRLAWLAEAFPKLRWHVENDFPAYGSGNMFVSDLLELEHSLCLDSSHLWATAYLFDLDFHAEVKRFFQSGRVGMVHLHASRYDENTPKAAWSDGHLPLSTPNRMDLPRLVRTGREAGVDYWVLEVVRATAEDVVAFGRMWEDAGR